MWHVKNTLTLLLTTSVVVTMSFVFAAKASAELVVREFAIPSGTVDLSSYIAQGADGNMWFTLPGSSLVGRVGVDGAVQMYPTPTSGSGPGSIKLGSDGNMWVAQSLVGKIAKVTPSGDFTEYSIGCQSSSISLGSDGNMWFGCGYSAARIGYITPDGNVTTFDMGTDTDGPRQIALGPDGNIWFLKEYISVGKKIAKVTPSGVFTEYDTPSDITSLYNIIHGPDGNLWFPASNGNVYSVSPSGEFSVKLQLDLDDILVATSLAIGPDSNVWFTGHFFYGGGYGYIDVVSGEVNRVAVGPSIVAIGRGGDNLWFMDYSKNTVGYITGIIKSDINDNNKDTSAPYVDLLKNETSNYLSGLRPPSTGYADSRYQNSFIEAYFAVLVVSAAVIIRRLNVGYVNKKQ